MQATPTTNKLLMRTADFSSLAEALDFAARGETGFNFYDGGGKLYAVLPYAELRENARVLARRLLSLGLERGARVALVADTQPEFVRFFFACQYAGLVPVPLPASLHLGGHRAYVTKLQRLLLACQASVAMAPKRFLPFLKEATKALELRFLGTPEAFSDLPEAKTPLRPLESKEIAYLQYTSGSTRFPRGVMITNEAVLSNLAAILNHGVEIRPGDRCVSWLPFYHDMGLVGLVLAPLASQVSVDYLSTFDFAMRPRLWLTLMTANQATISYSPPFGYELCARRLKNDRSTHFDLHAWRVAGVGAEMIRPETLMHFADILAPSGFDRRAFVACYGMAECSLAISFAPLGRGLGLDWVDGDRLSESREAVTCDPFSEPDPENMRCFVNCGQPLPGYDFEVRDGNGRPLPDRRCGTLFVRGPSVMAGYFGDLASTREVLSKEGWLNTGDLGYRVKGNILITGREKDLIIINGRNIWPQDLEHLAVQVLKVRSGDASAFAVPGPLGDEKAVMVIQCRDSDAMRCDNLIGRLHQRIREELGIDCFIELVPRNTLPRTTSGKPSRSGSRHDFLKRVASGQTLSPNLGSDDQRSGKCAV